MAPPVDRIANIAVLVLDVVRLGLDADGLVAPERYYVSPGLPAWDCEQLVVTAFRIYPVAATPATPLQVAESFRASFAQRAVELRITLLRCIPTVDEDLPGRLVIPSPADMQAAAVGILKDAQSMSNHLAAAVTNGTLPGCSGVMMQEWHATAAEGGLAGGLFVVSVLP